MLPFIYHGSPRSLGTQAIGRYSFYLIDSLLGFRFRFQFRQQFLEILAVAQWVQVLVLFQVSAVFAAFGDGFFCYLRRRTKPACSK